MSVADDNTAVGGLMSCLDEVRAMVTYLPPALRLVWTAASAWTGAWLVLLMLQGLLPAASVSLPKWVPDVGVIAAQPGGAWPAGDRRGGR